MKKTIAMFVGSFVAGTAAAGVICSGSGASVEIDTRTGTRVARATEPLAYSTEWNAGATGVTIALDGEVVFSAIAPVSGDYGWDASNVQPGLHTLSLDDGVEALSAQFAVAGILFNANGGEGTMASLPLFSGVEQSLSQCAFSRTGYTFAGWATASDGPVVYANGGVAEGEFDATSGETITLYARWSHGTYTVRFDANSGEGKMPDLTLGIDITSVLGANRFSKTGYTFAGWSSEADGAVAYADGALVTNLVDSAGATTTLHAVWTPNQYQVRFNKGAGTGSMPSQQLTYDAEQPLRANAFSRTGYTFVGWATEEGGAVVYADGAIVSNLVAEAGSIVDLYAAWSQGTYSVRFDANGGEGSMPDQALWLDIPCMLNSNAFTQTGLAFVGWATDEWGAVAYADGATVLNLAETVDDVVTLYARWADAFVETVDGIAWTYTVSNGEATIGDGWDATAVPSSTSGAITIPATLGGHPVTGIGDYAFSDCDGLTSVTIPASVTSLGEYIFGDCGNLATIIVDAANPVFDSRDNCNAIIRTADNTLVVGCENATIPNTVTTIGYNAFVGCGLMFITFPPSVTNIMDYAFERCDLMSVTIPDTVTSIGDGAFYGCSGLESVTISQGVSHIGESVFSDCYRLETIVVDGANPVYDSRDNCNAIIRIADNTLVAGCNSSIIPDSVTAIGNSAFFMCDGLLSVTIPDGVTSIGNEAFSYCSGITSMVIPGSVTNIGGGAFRNCTSLTSVSIPDSVTTIEWFTFSGCNQLLYDTSTIPGIRLVDGWVVDNGGTLSGDIDLTGIRGIGAGAFFGCDGIRSVMIPESCYGIGRLAFDQCDSLEAFVVDELNPVYDSRDNCNAIIRTADNSLVVGCKNSTIPDSVVAIGDCAFLDCAGLASVTIPDGVTSIGDYAFSGCSGLLSVVIPDSVTGIGDNAFEDCSNLQSLQLPLHFRENISSMSIPEGCTVAFHGNLNVVSEHGAPFPGIGANAIEVFNSATVSCHIDGIQNADVPGVRYVCAGWRGTGSVPASGTGTNVTFEIEENSSITWLWETNVWMECTVSGAADLSGSDSGWFLKDGEAAVFNFSPCHRPFVYALSGDADGVVVDAEAGTVTVPPDRPRLVRLIVATWRDAGEAVDSAPVAWSDVTDAKWQIAVDATASDGFCLRSGETTANGTSTIETTFDGPGVLSFNWRISAGRGDFARVYLDGVLQQSITRSTAWTTVKLEMRDGGHTVLWRYERGSASATGEDATFLDEVCWLPLSLSEALDTTNVVWTADGAKEWFPQVAVSHDGADAAKSGQVIGDDVSGLETTLVGPGTLSWFWRLDSEGNSGVDVMVDGNWLDAYEPTGEWTEESLAVGEGEHTIRFEFWNAGTAATITDCAYLDQVVWIPETPKSIEVDGVEVPVSWLDEYPTLVEEHSGSHEAAANAIAANGVNTVAECYVAGLVPTNAAAAFRAVISWKDGAPVITWEPDLNEGGTKHERVYTVEGRESLTQGSWGPTNANSHFFRVKVELK